MKYNLNDFVVIYPTDMGWKKIEEIIRSEYRFNEEDSYEFINRKKTSNGGYREQLWSIIADLSGLFFNGSPYLKNSFMDLDIRTLTKELYVIVDEDLEVRNVAFSEEEADRKVMNFKNKSNITTGKRLIEYDRE